MSETDRRDPLGQIALLSHRRTIVVLLVVFCVGAAFMIWQASSSHSRLIKSSALFQAAHESKLMEEFRTLYTSEVVRPAAAHGMEVTHDYASKVGAIPPPATLSMLLGKRIASTSKGGSTRLYSDYPFPWRSDGGPRDAFETEALRRLRQNPDDPFYRFEELNGQNVLRYATADVMRRDCVTCHNSHPDSSKADWMVGDVRGVLEVTLPMDTAVAQAHNESREAFMLVGVAGLFGMIGIAIVIRKFHGISTELEERVRLRTAELEENRKALTERVQLLALGSNIGVALAHGESTQAMLQQCGEAIVRNLDAAFARIWTISETGEMLELQASAGMYTHLDGPHGKVPVGKFKIGLIAQERKPHLTNQVVGDPRVSDQEWARREGMVAFAGHPLIIDGRLIGVVAMFARHPLSEATLAALESAADAIALGIDRKRQEEAHERAEQRTRHAVEAAPNGMVMVNEQGTITLVNTKIEEMFGYDRNALLRQPIEMLVPERFRAGHAEERGHFFQAPQARLMGEGRDLFAVRKDGSEFPVELGLNPIETEEGMMVLAAVVDITERKKAEQRIVDVMEQLERMAHYDSLTGVLNRHSFSEELEREWSRSGRSGTPLTCVMLDADYFKRINDTFGHAAGDEVLQKIAAVLEDNSRVSDRVARCGGEEFCVLLPDTDEDRALHWAEVIRQRLADEMFQFGDDEIRVTASFGVSQRLLDTGSPEELLRRADEALRVAKHLGRNQVVGFGQLNGLAKDGSAQATDAFGDISAQDMMVPLIVHLRESYTIQQAVELMLETRLESLPVIDNAGKLIGLITEEDLAVHLLAHDSWQCPVEERANRRTVCFPQDTPVQEVCEFLRRAAVRRVVVVDKNQQPIGMISRGAVLRWLRNAAGVNGPSGKTWSTSSSGLPQRSERLAQTFDQLDDQMITLRRQVEAESEEMAVSIIGGVSRIQEILDDALAQASGHKVNCNAAFATGSELLS